MSSSNRLFRHVRSVVGVMRSGEHRLGLIAMVAAFVTVAACGGSGSGAPTGNDPLTIDEYLSELKDIPRPLRDIFEHLGEKQDYFPNYPDYSKLPDLRRDQERVRSKVEFQASDGDRTVKWADGYSKTDAASFVSMISWDAWSGGTRPVHVTANWTLYLDDHENVIGYSYKETHSYQEAKSNSKQSER